MPKINIRGVYFDNLTLMDALYAIRQRLDKSEKMLIATANSEIVQMCTEDKVLLQTINSADMITADGIGVIYASRILGTPLKERVAGYDLACALLPELERTGRSLYLLGAAPGVAERAKERIIQKYPEINIIGTNDGFFHDDEKIIQRINTVKPDVVFVCLGAPKQENWMIQNRDRVCAGVMIGLGGCLDVFSGNTKRAPDIFIKLGLEWLYRLIKEPWRLKRSMRLPKFLFGTLFYKMTRGREE